MPDTLAAILVRIGKTALLAGALGLVLHAGLAVMAERPGAHLLLAALLALPMALLTTWQALEGWRSGEVPLWLTDAVRRNADPVAFPLALAGTALAALLFHGLWLWAGLGFVRLAG